MEVIERQRQRSPSVPHIVVHAPADDDIEPTFSYSCSDSVIGICSDSPSMSLFAAVFQLFSALPEMTEELPLDSGNPFVGRFVNSVRSFHLDYVGKDFSNVESLDLTWLLNLVAPSTENLNYSALGCFFIEHLLGRCKIGQRFKFLESSSIEPPRIYSRPKAFNFIKDCPINEVGSDSTINITLQKITESCSTINLASLFDTPSLLSDSKYFIELDLTPYPDSKSLDLIQLLQSYIGIETFFFGGPSPVRQTVYVPSVIEKPKANLFSVLPSILYITFKRNPTNNSDLFHRTSVEIPMDFDFGFAKSTVQKPPRTIGSKSLASKSTLFRLHGFVTQAESRFITYTRTRSSVDWVKIEDHKVLDMDLGSRVSSKGILMAVYRLQEQVSRKK